MTEAVGIRERTGQQATDEQATGEVATVEQTTSEQPVGEQASGEQASGEQTTSEQATGEQAIADLNGRHFKLSCFQPACPQAAAAAAETILYLVNECMTTALQWKPFSAKRHTLAKRTQFAVGQRLSSTYASGPPWLTQDNSPGAWLA